MPFILSHGKGYFRPLEPFLFRQRFLLCAMVITFIFNHLAGLAFFFAKARTFDGFLLTRLTECVTHTNHVIRIDVKVEHVKAVLSNVRLCG